MPKLSRKYLVIEIWLWGYKGTAIESAGSNSIWTSSTGHLSPLNLHYHGRLQFCGRGTVTSIPHPSHQFCPSGCFPHPVHPSQHDNWRAASCQGSFRMGAPDDDRQEEVKENNTHMSKQLHTYRQTGASELQRFKRSGFNHANHIIQMISNTYSMLPWSQSEEDGPNLRSVSLKGRAAHCLWETSLLALHFTDEICKWRICLISKSTSLHLSFLGQLTVHSGADGGRTEEDRDRNQHMCSPSKAKRKWWIFIGGSILAGGGYCLTKKRAKTTHSWGWWFSYTCS